MIYDVVIIGSGPAGLAAAVYGQRARLWTLVLEKQPMSGGQILNTYEVDNYPGFHGISGLELGQKLKKHADELGMQLKTEEVQKISKVNGLYRLQLEEEQILTRTLILAMGAKHRELGIPGEQELCGMGVSYCATCDGAFFKNRTVAVVGGGDVALEDALFLARICTKVYLIHRRDEFRGARVLQERVTETENIEICYDSEVEQIHGEDQVTGITLYKKKEQSEQLDVDGVFIAVGITPNTECVRNLVRLDESGYIIAGEDGVTSEPGVFAAGDIRTKQLRQVVTAVSDGANAITSVERYLNQSS